LAVMEFVTAGRRGSWPLRGNFLFACPPALPDMLAVLESVTAGRRGSRPLRGNFLHALLSHYVGSVHTFRNLLRRASQRRLTSLHRLAASG
jgi:hypothetical protein